LDLLFSVSRDGLLRRRGRRHFSSELLKLLHHRRPHLDPAPALWGGHQRVRSFGFGSLHTFDPVESIWAPS